jgi:hypothetical protein
MPSVVKMYGIFLFAILFVAVGAWRTFGGGANSKELTVPPSKEVLAPEPEPAAAPEPEPVPEPAPGPATAALLAALMAAEVPEAAPVPEAVPEVAEEQEQSNPNNWYRDSYGETQWQEFEFAISMMEYELEEYEKEIAGEAGQPSDLSPEDLEDRRQYIEKIRVELEVMRDVYADRMATEPPRYDDDEEREQFDFGDSVADW